MNLLILVNQVILEKLMILVIFRESGDFHHLRDSGESYNLVIRVILITWLIQMNQLVIVNLVI